MAEPIEAAWTEACQEQVEQCRQFYERGDFSRAVLALKWCIAGGLPLPDWLAPEVESAIEFFFRKGGASGSGKGGGHFKRYQRQRMHRLRHQVAEAELAKRGIDGFASNRPEAFELASKRLQGTFAQGSPDQIEDSFDKVQAELRPLRQKRPV